MSRIFVDRISPYQSGSVQVDGLSIDTGSLATKVELNSYTASNDSKVDSLISATGSYASTGANTFTGDQVISGSVTIGNGGRFSNPIALADNTQQDFFGLTDVNISGKPFQIASVGYQDYPSYGQYFEDIFAIEQADSVAFNYYNGLYINGVGTSLNLQPSGSTLSTIRLRDVGASSEATISANTISTNGSLTHTGDQVISGSVTIGNGGRLSNPMSLGDNTQQDIFSITDANVNGKPFQVATVGFQDYPSYGPFFEDVWAMEFADSFSFNYYNGLYVNGVGTTMNLQPSGSTLSTIRLRDAGASSQATITANEVNINATSTPLTITGTTVISGSTTTTDFIQQNYSAPGNNAQIDNIKVSGLTSKYGYNIDATNYGFQHYDSSDINGFGWDLYTSNFAVGNGMYLNPHSFSVYLNVSGSAYSNSGILLKDNGNQTSTFEVLSDTLQVDKVMQLQPQDPLPGGALGQLAVSGSDLYFHNGSTWVLK